MTHADVLTIMGEDAYLSGHTIWGVLRGLETFSQLVHENNVGAVSHASPHTYLQFIFTRHVTSKYISSYFKPSNVSLHMELV